MYIEDIKWCRLFESSGKPSPEIHLTAYENGIYTAPVGQGYTSVYVDVSSAIESKEYGVEWDYSNPSPALTRTGDAVGFADPIPATSLVGVGSSPFDNIMPWSGMKMCNIIDGEVEFWQGDPQFSETDYDTMVYIPEFWYKAEKDIANHKWQWSISPTERDGYAKHPGSGRYISRFHTAGSSAGVYSKSGVLPLAAMTRDNFRDYSHNKGSGWWMLDIATWSAIQMLYIVEFANFYSQDKLGTGQISESAAASGGTTGAKYHTIKRSSKSNQYRWVENPYSNVQVLLDGIMASDKEVYTGTDNNSFSGGITSLSKTGIILPETNAISGFGYSTVCPYAFVPDKSHVMENVATYVTDNVNSRTGDSVISTGGYASGGDGYGLFYFNAYISVSGTNKVRGSRLIYIQ